MATSCSGKGDGIAVPGTTYRVVSSMSQSCSRKSIGVLPPMSIDAASASTLSRGVAAAQGERYSR